MKRDGGCLERCWQGWCGEGKIPDWFLVLDREPHRLQNENGGVR